MPLDTRVLINPPRAAVPHTNCVLNGHPRDYHDPGFDTSLTLKSVVQGSVLYTTPKSRYRVEADRVVVMNPGQRYALDAPAEWSAETLALFFQPGFVEDIVRTDSTDHRKLLDAPTGALRPCFVERSFPKNGRLRAQLDQLHGAIEASRRLPDVAGRVLEEVFYAIALQLVRLQVQSRSEASVLPAKRISTRAELYRRVHYARDYMHACYAAPLTIAAVARVANMSPFHFLRTFKHAFGVTPLQYLQARRLAAARELLALSDLPVAEVCSTVGFSSLGSFSWLCRRKLGASPTALRRRAARMRPVRRKPRVPLVR